MKNITKAQLVVYNAIKKFEPSTYAHIARIIKKNETTVKFHIMNLLKMKVIQRHRYTGVFTIKK